MKKTVLYVYLGENGTITSTIYLPGVYSVKKYQLQAEDGKFLTPDGGLTIQKNAIIPESELSNWKEVVGQI